MKNKLIIFGIVSLGIVALGIVGVIALIKPSQAGEGTFSGGFSTPFNNLRAQPWTDSGTVTYLNDQTNDFAVGGTDSSAALWLDESTETLIIGGKIGANTSTPQVEIQALGLMGIYPKGTGTTTCSGLIEGALMYSTGTQGFFGCDGSSWSSL